jgi:hypothetical protein
MAVFTVKRNDTHPLQSKLEKQALDGSWGPAFPSPTGVSVVFSARMVGTPDPPKIQRAAATIVKADGIESIVQYAPNASAFDTVGEYQCEWEVTYATGTVETFPSETYIRLVVIGDIA